METEQTQLMSTFQEQNVDREKGIMKVKNDHRSKFSNLSNWKEEA